MRAAEALARYGAAAVFGARGATERELRCIAQAERVAQAYQSRDDYRDADGQRNWAEWTQRHRAQAELLIAVAELSNGED